MKKTRIVVRIEGVIVLKEDVIAKNISLIAMVMVKERMLMVVSQRILRVAVNGKLAEMNVMRIKNVLRN